jgi:hypothetical protein
VSATSDRRAADALERAADALDRAEATLGLAVAALERIAEAVTLPEPRAVEDSELPSRQGDLP